MILITIIILIFAGVFFTFGVGTLLEKDVSGLKIMLIGLHITVFGLILSITQFGLMGEGGLVIATLGFMLSIISFVMDSREG